MKKHLLIPSLLAMTAITILVIGCKKSDNGTGPNSTGHQVYMQLHAGDQYVYNRWTLDSLTNSKVASSKRGYRIDIKKGSSFIGGYQDWFYRIGMDSSTFAKDTLYIRPENWTKSDNTILTKYVQVYGFRTQLLRQFVFALNSQLPVGYPTIPSEEWDIVAKYYDDSGNPIPVGTTWYIGASDGTPYTLNFNVGGYPISINAVITSTYDAKDEPYMVGTKQVLKWRNTIKAVFSASAVGVNIPVTLTFSFSDDPDGEIIYQKNSTQITIPVIGTFFILGEVQELSWFQQI
jgi:hypothetical protein